MKQRGFTLIELLIVLSILALLAAIMIPSLIHARQEHLKWHQQSQPQASPASLVPEIKEPTMVTKNVFRFPSRHVSGKDVFEKSLQEWLLNHPGYEVTSIALQPGDGEWQSCNLVTFKRLE